MAAAPVTVDLLWRDVAASGEPIAGAAPIGKQSKQVALPEDGRTDRRRIHLEAGKSSAAPTVQVAVQNPPADDHNRSDNALDADVEITIGEIAYCCSLGGDARIPIPPQSTATHSS